jgi:phage FluMu protein Com
MTPNPLAKYYRAPGINVRLPSGGRFQPEGNVTFAPNGDVPVLPMRGADEMLMKSPDALMSGHAIESCIRSCVPNIADPQRLPTPDVDAVLLAIRASTFGDQMDIECECPKCKAENTFAFSISAILDTAVPLEPEYPVRLNDEVIVYVRPFNLVTSTNISTLAFQEARKMQILEDSDASEEEKQRELNISFDRINQMNVESIVDSIEMIVVPEGQVIDRSMIRDFINNIPADWTKKIELQLKKVNEAGVQKDQEVQCAKCQELFKTTVEFDPSNFFG